MCVVLYIRQLLCEFGHNATSASILQLLCPLTDIMQYFVGALCILGFIARTCNAYVVAEAEESSVDKIVDAESKRVGGEAIVVGQILIEAARQLNVDAKLKTESDEYLRDIWESVKGVVKDFGKSFKDSANNTIAVVKTSIKAATDQAKEKIKEKTLEILAKLFSNTLAGYAFGDFETRGEMVNALSSQINAVGHDILEKGKKLSGQ